ncbi:hypothetical protein G6F54_014549 [Rhizopus delemar]|nr:hypothetical protein G6F54_014549 [Rhizopus delemar]
MWAWLTMMSGAQRHSAAYMPSAHSRSRSGVARGALACRSTARGNNGLGLGDAGSTSSVKPSIQMPSQ